MVAYPKSSMCNPWSWWVGKTHQGSAAYWLLSLYAHVASLPLHSYVCPTLWCHHQYLLWRSCLRHLKILLLWSVQHEISCQNTSVKSNYDSKSWNSCSKQKTRIENNSIKGSQELTWYLSGKVWTQPRILMSQSFAVPSSEPLTISCGPLLAGQQLFTNEECSAIFLICKSHQARIFNKWKLGKKLYSKHLKWYHQYSFQSCGKKNIWSLKWKTPNDLR